MSINIEIRRAKPSDYVGMQQLFSDPAVIYGTMQLPYPSEELWRERLEEPPLGLYLLLACDGDEVIGQITLITHPQRPRRAHAAGIGLTVRSDYHGQGIGTRLLTEVLEMGEKWLNITRFELEVFADNEAAIHIYKKLGFEIEGKHTKHAFRDGSYEDVYSMARLKNRD